MRTYMRAMDHRGKPRKGGRLYGVGPCMARLSSAVRIRVLPRQVVIVDIRAAHPTIQFQLAAHHGYLAEHLMEFTPDGDIDKGRRKVAQEVGVSVDTAKTLVTALTYGAGLQIGVKAAVNEARDQEQREQLARVESATLEAIHRDAATVGQLIVPKGSHYVEEAASRTATKKRAGNYKSSEQKTATALLSQDIENGCLTAMTTSVESMGWKPRAFIHDALAFELETDELDDNVLCDELSRDIEELTKDRNAHAPPGTRGFTGFSLHLTAQRSGVDGPLPDTWKKTK